MDGSKKASASKGKKKTQQDDEAEMIDTSSKNAQEFVDKMKKRATVKTHGIDNVSGHSITLKACHVRAPIKLPGPDWAPREVIH